MIDEIPRTLFVYKHTGIDTAEIRGKQIATGLGCDSIPMPELTSSFAARFHIRRIADRYREFLRGL